MMADLMAFIIPIKKSKHNSFFFIDLRTDCVEMKVYDRVSVSSLVTFSQLSLTWTDGLSRFYLLFTF
jgi:hypothetical protein